MTTTYENRQSVDTRRAFRRIDGLLATYFGIGVAALAATVLMRGDPAEVNPAVWTRGIIVVVTAMALAAFAARAARGSRSAYRRVRIISAITPVVIAILVALPGTFPLWVRIEQSVCGLVMLGVAVIANGRHLRGVFARRQ